MRRPSFPKGAVVRTTIHATHISQCLVPRFPPSLLHTQRRHHEQHNSTALYYPGCVYAAARKPNSQRGWEKASTFLPTDFVYIQAMLDFRFFCATRSIAKPQVMGADFPRVLQRFSIMPPQARLSTQILRLLACLCACAPRCCDWCSFKGKCSRVCRCTHFARAGVCVCACVFFFFFLSRTLVQLWCARVCKFKVMFSQRKV